MDVIAIRVPHYSLYLLTRPCGQVLVFSRGHHEMLCQISKQYALDFREKQAILSRYLNVSTPVSSVRDGVKVASDSINAITWVALEFTRHILGPQAGVSATGNESATHGSIPNTIPLLPNVFRHLVVDSVGSKP